MDTEELNRLSLADKIHILLFIVGLLARRRLGTLRPLDLLYPAALIQMFFFAWVVSTSDNILPVLAVGNLAIVAVALLPITSRRPRVHWVR